MPPNGATTARDRKARAGQLLVENPAMSQAEALRRAGYAESTSKVPKANGLSADRCIAAAAEAGLVPSSSKIRDTSRRLLQKKMGRLLDHDHQLDKARPGEIARIADVAERWHGAGAEETQARTLDARLSALERLQRILARAEQDNDAQPTVEHDGPGL